MTMSDKAAFGSNRFPGQRPVNAAPLSSWPCRHCGRINMALARFCGKCGATREPAPLRPAAGWKTAPGPVTGPGRESPPAPVPHPAFVAPAALPFPAVAFPAQGTGFRPREPAEAVDPGGPRAGRGPDVARRPPGRPGESPSGVRPVGFPTPSGGGDPADPADQPPAWRDDRGPSVGEGGDLEAGPEPGSPGPARPEEDSLFDQEEAAPAAPSRNPSRRRARSRSRFPRSARALWRRLGWKVSLMAVGLFLVLPLLGMVTQRGAAGRNGSAPVCWSDFQSYLSRHLGITLEEADVLARAAWGAVPQPDVTLTVDQARAVEAVLNQKEEEKIRLIPPTVIGGNLRQEHLAAGPTASAEGRFLDVSLDHPVYLALASLLKLELPVAGPDGQARPYEPVRWDEWGRLLEALSRSAGADERIGRSFWTGKNGDLSGEDLRRSLLEVRSVLGLPIAGTDGNPGPETERPTRLEALGALSHILSELETHASTTSQ